MPPKHGVAMRINGWDIGFSGKHVWRGALCTSLRAASLTPKLADVRPVTIVTRTRGSVKV